MDPDNPGLRDLLERYVLAWRLADVDAFVALVTEDVRLSMPPMNEWFEGIRSVGAFVENAIFGPARPSGIPLVGGSCNGRPAFAPYAPDQNGSLTVGGLQLLEVVEGPSELKISSVVSFRDPMVTISCGFQIFRRASRQEKHDEDDEENPAATTGPQFRPLTDSWCTWPS